MILRSADWIAGFAIHDIGMWKRFTRETVESRREVVVCSPDDARRVNARNVVVVPNGIDRPTRSVRQPSRSHPPTLLFQGQMTYPPNADGAMYFVDRVLPRIVAVMPRVQFRIVGRCDHAVARLRAHPNVTVTDHVVDMEPELHTGDVVVVPLRFGSGTRLKIIEAFADRIPVVSTTIGAEGLGVTPGQELLRRGRRYGTRRRLPSPTRQRAASPRTGRSGRSDLRPSVPMERNPRRAAISPAKSQTSELGAMKPIQAAQVALFARGPANFR